MSLNQLSAEIHHHAVLKGWWNQPRDERIKRLIEWLHEEVDEVEKEWETHGDEAYYSTDAQGLRKPEGFVSELIDVIAIAADMIAGVEQDGDRAWSRKMRYNRIRKYRRDAKGVRLAD